MSRFEDMIHGLQQDTEVPEYVWQRYMEALSTLPDKENRGYGAHAGRSRRWMLPVAAAAALTVGVVSVSASAYLHWSRSLEEKLQITTEQEQVLEEQKLAAPIGQSVTQGDVTVTAQQSIVDNYVAYLSFKVEGYEVEEGVQPDFASVDIQIEGEGDYTLGRSYGFYNGMVVGSDGGPVHASDGTPWGEDEAVNYMMEDGSLEYLIRMVSAREGAFLDKQVHVELKDLGIYKQKAGDITTEAEGTWSFDWTLTGSDEMKEYELNAPLGDSGATLVQAELSPVSISLQYDLPRREETEQAVDQDGNAFIHTTYAEPPYFYGVQLKDGTILGHLSNGGAEGYEDDQSDLYHVRTSFTRVITVDEVESLLFVKSSPAGEQPLTEENLYVVPLEAGSNS